MASDIAAVRVFLLYGIDPAGICSAPGVPNDNSPSQGALAADPGGSGRKRESMRKLSASSFVPANRFRRFRQSELRLRRREHFAEHGNVYGIDPSNRPPATRTQRNAMAFSGMVGLRRAGFRVCGLPGAS